MEKRIVKTGIPGLDELLGGGFREGDLIGIEDSIGAGKTVFCIQFLYMGATEYGEKGLYIPLEERPDDVRQDMESFDWDIEKVERSGDLFIKVPINWRMIEEEKKIDEICLDIQGLVSKHKVKRVAVDSISALITGDNTARVRSFLYSLFTGLLEEGATTLVTIEKTDTTEPTVEMEAAMVRGLIALRTRRIDNRRTRTIEILKMRGIKHSMAEHLMKITNKGIVIYPGTIVGDTGNVLIEV